MRQGYEQRVPRTAAEFAEYFRRSEFARLNAEDVDAYRAEFVGKPERVAHYKSSVKLERANHTRSSSPYIVSIPMQARALMLRRLQIIRGGIAAQVIQLASFVLQAITISTVFLRLDNTTVTFFSRGGVLFFALLFAADPGTVRAAADRAQAEPRGDVPPVRGGPRAHACGPLDYARHADRVCAHPLLLGRSAADGG